MIFPGFSVLSELILSHCSTLYETDLTFLLLKNVIGLIYEITASFHGNLDNINKKVNHHKNSLPVIRQKSDSQNGGNKKAKHAKFSEKRTFLTYQGVTNVCLSENLACLSFLLPQFWDLPFCLITDELKPKMENKQDVKTQTSPLHKLTHFHGSDLTFQEVT